MSRLAAVRPAQATPEQREVFDAIAGGDRGRGRSIESLLDARGGLAGPFNAWVHRPDLGSIVHRLGERLRFHGTLPGAAREIAILAVGARWMAEYEWWAHTRVGRGEGVSEETIDAIRRGERPAVARSGGARGVRFHHRLARDRQGGFRGVRRGTPRRSATRGSSSSSPWPATTPWCRSPSTRSRCRCPTASPAPSRIDDRRGTAARPATILAPSRHPSRMFRVPSPTPASHGCRLRAARRRRPHLLRRCFSPRHARRSRR